MSSFECIICANICGVPNIVISRVVEKGVFKSVKHILYIIPYDSCGMIGSGRIK